MYQFSLNWFINLYESVYNIRNELQFVFLTIFPILFKSIENSEKSDLINIRIRNLNSFFTYSIYKNVSQSLLEKDKLLFSFILCISIMKAK